MGITVVKCRRELYCKHGIAEDEEGEKDLSDKDPKRCFKCLATNYSLFEPNVDEDDEDE